ncbi:hypothetical protein E5Q53_00315 [Haemophilus parahaemolyticus]|uniref:G domain-containing protein n=2 Tax=Haemophilus parahaemolyticus TaxID=735 RepID=A0AAE6MNH0_HAEPH|nr:GTPase [Haemophilus parahaemolyticus]EIJ73199.1 hypothetical protein HMPREF1050_0288 [Haemophilus parahaemolyticus HK385]OOR97641.1 hypothetical protein B0185_02230 [Haemophilus parahaemolyticus]QEN10023.1 hypothetical protein E5Q53_00315 [Haemophilus parahaemolyticus]QRP13011.1 50S ribosome-binding GTPase [Haemophilus parahaemolyticus]STO66140.1 SGP [Haemophilus parahaemolyticus HK385]
MAFSKKETQAFINQFPNYREKIERYIHLTSTSDKPCVAVFGKYNHGKSTLLNALINQNNYFKASDKRETQVNKVFLDQKNNLAWLDTPGLGADVHGIDDFEANKGVFVSADIVLIIHTLKAGELDKEEVEHIKRLLNTSKNDNKLLVLTQIDETNAEQQVQAVKRIREQVPLFEPILVSAKRYLTGIEKQQPQLMERSGIPELNQKILGLTKTVQKQRETEINKLKTELDGLLNNRISEINSEISLIKNERKAKRQAFSHQLDQILKSI